MLVISLPFHVSEDSYCYFVNSISTHFRECILAIDKRESQKRIQTSLIVVQDPDDKCMLCTFARVINGMQGCNSILSLTTYSCKLKIKTFAQVQVQNPMENQDLCVHGFKFHATTTTAPDVQAQGTTSIINPYRHSNK